MTQPSLLDDGAIYRKPVKAEPSVHFDGPADDATRNIRLGQQLEDIKTLMLDGRWRTLDQIQRATGHPAASISAQLRHLRKPRFGWYVMEKRHLGRGLYEYHVEARDE